MAVKFYSDVTKKFYDDVSAAERAEKELEVKKNEAAEARKKLAKEVDEKMKAYHKARDEYYKVLEAFCNKYGSYHMTLDKNSLDRWLEDFFRF